MSSPIIEHFFVSLFAVVHGAEYAPISLHRAQGAFIPREPQLNDASWWCALREGRGIAAHGTRRPEKETKNRT